MNQILTAEEVADRLSLNVEVAKRMLRAGTIKGFKLNGRLWRVDEADLQAYIDKAKHDTN